MKKTKSKSFSKSLCPYSMEYLADYLRRFINNPDMQELFPNPRVRYEMAIDEFESKWSEALVTVTLANGTRYFID